MTFSVWPLKFSVVGVGVGNFPIARRASMVAAYSCDPNHFNTTGSETPGIVGVRFCVRYFQTEANARAMSLGEHPAFAGVESEAIAKKLAIAMTKRGRTTLALRKAYGFTKRSGARCALHFTRCTLQLPTRRRHFLATGIPHRRRNISLNHLVLKPLDPLRRRTLKRNSG